MNESYSLCFVMPAHRRYFLSEITFAQRRWVCDELAKVGIKADCVVITDDDNTDIAKDNGFHVVKQDNEFLGRRFNDGHELAGKLGYDFSVPVGSDMFLDPKLFVGLTDNFTITNLYAVVKPNGRRLATMSIEWGILQIIPLRLMAHEALRFRPCAEAVVKGCDTLTRNRIKSRNGEELELVSKNVHEYECVSFQSRVQITNFERLAKVADAEIKIGNPRDLLLRLKQWYPHHLVDAVIDYYESGLSLKQTVL